MIEIAVNAPYANDTHPNVLLVVDLLSLTNKLLLFFFTSDTLLYSILSHNKVIVLCYNMHHIPLRSNFRLCNLLDSYAIP